MDEYPIYFAQERIGTAEVTKEGLYYRICCRCAVCGDVPLRVRAAATAEVDLGLCIPMGDVCGMVVRIPVKYVGQGSLRFRASATHTATEEMTVISPNEPFGYIARLKDAYLMKRGQVIGICYRITDQSPVPLDSDQNP